MNDLDVMKSCSPATARTREVRHREGERGIAMIMAITVIVTLAIIATAFAPMMQRSVDRAEANAARLRADEEARLLLKHAEIDLARGAYPNEVAMRESGNVSGTLGDPDVDTRSEFEANDAFRARLMALVEDAWLDDPAMAQRLATLKTRGLSPFQDDRGSIWQIEVDDAQARINANGGQPFLIANLLGSALLVEELDAGATEISVNHVTSSALAAMSGFPRDGGFIRIGNEVIKYQSFDGQTFSNCERGAARTAILGDNAGAQRWPALTPVIDYTAYLIATHQIARRPGQLTKFKTIEDIQSIAALPAGVELPSHRLAQLRPFLTLHSGRETSGGFLQGQLLTQEIGNELEATSPDTIQVQDSQNNTGTTWYFNPGTIVRIRDGNNLAYQTVAMVGDGSGGQIDREFVLSGNVNADLQNVEDAQPRVFRGGRASVEAMAPYPVNINTASREVLFAVMANLQHRLAKQDDQVITPALAMRLADEIVRSREGKLEVVSGTEERGKWRRSGPFRSVEDWGRFLREKVRAGQLSRAQEFALYTNAVAPSSRDLRFGTAPWCFRTLDVYEIEARVTINSRSGDQIARAAIRETVEIGAERIVDWSLDSQADWELRLQQGHGAKFVATYPYKVNWISEGTHHVHPRPRALQHIVSGVYPSRSEQDQATSYDIGDVRLEPVRMRLPGAVVVEHFDRNTYQDGHFTGYDGVYERPVRGALRGDNQDQAQPFSMSFWWRCFSESGSWTAFDCGMERYMNRFAIFSTEVDGEQQLVFRACAGTMEERAAEVYVPIDRLDYEPGNWYHIHVSCAGEDPSTMQMLVDGVDIGKRRGITTLESGVDTTGTELIVENTDGFAPFGAVQIGTEIIEYESLANGALRDCIRGARGTTPGDWSPGTPVRILGYSMPLTVDIMAGGAYLDEDLRRWSAVRVSGVDGYDDTTEVMIEGLPTPVTVGGYNSANTQPQNLTVTGMWGQDTATGVGAFNSKGFALLGCNSIGNLAEGGSEETIGGWEVVYYERTGENFTVTRYQETDFQDKAEEYFCATHIVSFGLDWPCYLVPISVMGFGGTEPDDYLNPASQDEQILSRYASENEDLSARVLLPNSEGQVEAIRYDSTDSRLSAPHVLFIRDRNIGRTVRHFYNQETDLDANQQPDDPDEEPTPPDLPDDPDDPGDDDDTPPGPGDIDPPTPDPGDEPDGPDGPGGGVPPGLREPGDPEDGDTGEPGESDDPDEPGTGEPTDGEGGVDGDLGDSESTDTDEPIDDSTEDPDDLDEESGPSGPGGGVEPGGRGGGSGLGNGEGSNEGPPPSEIEPPPDGSGGGDTEDPAEDDEFEGDPGGFVPPGLRDPEDPDDDSGDEGDGGGGTDAWDPEREPDGGPEAGRQTLQMRGVNGTDDLDHLSPGGQGDSDSMFLPCFKAWEAASGGLSRRAGRNDVITVSWGASADAPPQRWQGRVRWGDEQSNWMALGQFTEQRIAAAERGARTYRLDYRDYPRILKFPCGELPDELPTTMEFGRSTLSGSGLVTAFLDELYIWRHPIAPKAIVVDAEGVDPSASSISLAAQAPAVEFNGTPGFEERCGLFLVNGELMVYRESFTDGNGVRLERLARGMFGTTTRTHPLGSYGVFLADIPVSYLEGSLSADSPSIGLAHMENWPREGLVRIVGEGGGELIHYTRRTESELLMPEAIDSDESIEGRGLLRGRFGTDAIDHDSNAIVIFTPSRYWDRFTPRDSEEDQAFSGVHDHPESAYLEIGTRVRDAWWHNVRWEENLDGAIRGDDDRDRNDGGGDSGYLDLMVMARFNPNVPWDSRRVIDLRSDGGLSRGGAQRARPDHLMIMDNPEEANRMAFEAGTAEFRVYFVYKANAFEFVDLPGEDGVAEDPVLTNYWKRSPWLSSFSTSYTNRTRPIQMPKAGRGR